MFLLISYIGDTMIFERKQIIFSTLVLLTALSFTITFKSKVSPAFSSHGHYCVVLDAGHGSPDGGAVGANGTEEKDINLKIVLKIREILETRGVKVILTRDGDSGIYDKSAQTIHEMKVSDMHNRLKIINSSGADLFISIHMNSFTSSKSHGLHIFYSRNHPEAESTAELIQNNIANITGAQTHAVKTASDTLYLMKKPVPPAILAECGFLSNPDEEKLLNTADYQSKIAFAVANAVLEQFFR